MDDANNRHPLQIVLEDHAGQDCRGYSGRGMGGRECLSVHSDSGPGEFFAELLQSVADLARDDAISDRDVEEICRRVSKMRSDSMGRGAVFYFEGIPFVGSGDEDGDGTDGDEP